MNQILTLIYHIGNINSMIISHKHKYIFIGLPMTGSSAISKELIELYGGESIYMKHTNIPYLIKKTNINIKDYYVFGVYRDPIEMAYSQYSKIKVNAKGAFTNKDLLTKNGGYVTEKQYNFFKNIQSDDYSFLDFIKSKYSFVVYDNPLSINYKYLDHIISFHNLSNGFKEVLTKCDLESKREIPVYNKTIKNEDSPILLPPKIIKKVFSPFLKEYTTHDYGKRDFDISWFSILKYKIAKPLRILYINYRDSKRDHKFDFYFSKITKNGE